MTEPVREELVRTLAIETGFSVAGIAPVSPHDNANDTYDRWLEAGKHAGMGWLIRHRPTRRDPVRLLDGARSAICVGLNYYQDVEKKQRDADGRGVFSIYAHGRDYHQVMEEMLDRLAARLEEQFPGIRTLACVDTRPVSDRTMAIRAGIGWLGKNSSVISPGFGSWIFLGELITDLDLAPDMALETLCANCTRCIDACPTGALENPFVVDARLCISYLTIEHRGEIPAQLQPKIGGHLYGCDTCQSVCPFNKVAVQSDHFDRGQGSPLVDKTPGELEKISDEKFRELTAGSAIRRCKPEGMRRNAAIVSGNIARRGGSERTENGSGTPESGLCPDQPADE
jgi:epoxyqueuosine reductase